MSRQAARVFFGMSVALAGTILVAAATLTLGSSARPDLDADELALVKTDAVRADHPLKIDAPVLSGLDRLANARREGRERSLWGPRSRPQGMPIFVVRSADGIRAFLGVDPRTGCALLARTVDAGSVDAVAFQDTCHGTTYDVSGRPKGGPGAWSLDELVLHVRGGVVYAETHTVIAGALAYRY